MTVPLGHFAACSRYPLTCQVEAQSSFTPALLKVPDKTTGVSSVLATLNMHLFVKNGSGNVMYTMSIVVSSCSLVGLSTCRWKLGSPCTVHSHLSVFYLPRREASLSNCSFTFSRSFTFYDEKPQPIIGTKHRSFCL